MRIQSQRKHMKNEMLQQQKQMKSNNNKSSNNEKKKRKGFFNCKIETWQRSQK